MVAYYGCVFLMPFVFLVPLATASLSIHLSHSTNIRRYALALQLYIKTSGSESRPRKVELASAHKKRDDYRKYFTHNNEACKTPTKQPYRSDIFIS